MKNKPPAVSATSHTIDGITVHCTGEQLARRAVHRIKQRSYLRERDSGHVLLNGRRIQWERVAAAQP